MSTPKCPPDPDPDPVPRSNGNYGALSHAACPDDICLNLSLLINNPVYLHHCHDTYHYQLCTTTNASLSYLMTVVASLLLAGMKRRDLCREAGELLVLLLVRVMVGEASVGRDDIVFVGGRVDVVGRVSRRRRRIRVGHYYIIYILKHILLRY
jgi:hypothetical protein